jgi:hypothetical protein
MRDMKIRGSGGEHSMNRVKNAISGTLRYAIGAITGSLIIMSGLRDGSAVISTMGGILLLMSIGLFVISAGWE